MRPTIRLFDGHVHKPLIRFLGKRTPSNKPHTPHPHPAAPPEIASHFSDFLKRFNSSAQPTSSSRSTSNQGDSSAGSQSHSEFWDAPSRLWGPSRTLDEAEIEAVLSGGASLR